MGKGKKKHSVKDQITDDVLDVAALSVRKFRKVTRELGKLSMGQKLVGSVALLAAGLTYLLKKQAEEEASSDSSSDSRAHGDNSRLSGKPGSEAFSGPDNESESAEKERKTKKAKHAAHA